MSDGSIRVHSADGITTLTIDRPAKRNAMTAAMCEQLRAALEAFRDGDDRAAIIAAEGEVFTAGADLTNPPSQFWKALPEVGVDVRKPVIAAVDGPVIGLGVVLVAFCDLCVASRRARFVYPEARVGVAAGLVSSLAARVPHKIAMELMLLGEPIEAQRAYDVGFVNRVVEPGQALAEARRLAEPLTRSAPLVLELLRRMVGDTLPRSPIESMYRAQLAAERVSASDDAREGLAAFREKRAPRFTGR